MTLKTENKLSMRRRKALLRANRKATLASVSVSDTAFSAAGVI